MCITHTSKFELWRVGVLSCIICTDLLEFVAAKFYLNLTSAQLFHSFLLTEESMVHIITCLNSKLTQDLEQIHRHVHTKNTCSKNMLTLGEVKLWANTHSSGYFSITMQNILVWTKDITYFQSSFSEYCEACGKTKKS